MFEYINEILKTFVKIVLNMAGTKSTVAPDNLFTINKECEKLLPDKAVEFHNVVAKMLYMTKQARLDTCTAIAFLMTRVCELDKDDWDKLVHLLKYIRGTQSLPLILSADGSGILKWWVDASFGVHPNMHGHSGGRLSMGQGFPIVSSTKQKLNSHSLMESEVIGVNDYMLAICWM